MNLPRTSAPSSPPFPVPFLPVLPAPRSALVHPLCLGVHGIYKHHSASVDSLFLPPVSFQSPASLSSTLPLSLTLNKKSLLIARNLWDTAPHRLTSSFFLYLFLYLIFVHFFVPAFVPFPPVRVLFLKLRKCVRFYYRFFANYLHMRTYYIFVVAYLKTRF